MTLPLVQAILESRESSWRANCCFNQSEQVGFIDYKAIKPMIQIATCKYIYFYKHLTPKFKYLDSYLTRQPNILIRKQKHNAFAQLTQNNTAMIYPQQHQAKYFVIKSKRYQGTQTIFYKLINIKQIALNKMGGICELCHKSPNEEPNFTQIPQTAQNAKDQQQFQLELLRKQNVQTQNNGQQKQNGQLQKNVQRQSNAEAQMPNSSAQLGLSAQSEETARTKLQDYIKHMASSSVFRLEFQTEKAFKIIHQGNLYWHSYINYGSIPVQAETTYKIKRLNPEVNDFMSGIVTREMFGRSNPHTHKNSLFYHTTFDKKYLYEGGVAKPCNQKEDKKENRTPKKEEKHTIDLKDKKDNQGNKQKKQEKENKDDSLEIVVDTNLWSVAWKEGNKQLAKVEIPQNLRKSNLFLAISMFWENDSLRLYWE